MCPSALSVIGWGRGETQQRKQSSLQTHFICHVLQPQRCSGWAHALWLLEREGGSLAARVMWGPHLPSSGPVGNTLGPEKPAGGRPHLQRVSQGGAPGWAGSPTAGLICVGPTCSMGTPTSQCIWGSEKYSDTPSGHSDWGHDKGKLQKMSCEALLVLPLRQSLLLFCFW